MGQRALPPFPPPIVWHGPSTAPTLNKTKQGGAGEGCPNQDPRRGHQTGCLRAVVAPATNQPHPVWNLAADMLLRLMASILCCTGRAPASGLGGEGCYSYCYCHIRY